MLATGKNKSIKSHDMTSTVVKIQSWLKNLRLSIQLAQLKQKQVETSDDGLSSREVKQSDY